MILAEPSICHKVLLVDDDAAVRDMMTATLEHKGFRVVSAANVTEALKHITTESFDVLLTDLHMPNPGDGFTVVTAMRHSQPGALTLLVSGYPDVQSAMDAILLEADEIIVKPFNVGRLADLIREKMVDRRPAARREKERVGAILQRCIAGVIQDWLARAKQSSELKEVALSDQERTGHLPKLVEDLVDRLSRPSVITEANDAVSSDAAIAHGKLRYLQGYTPAMLVHESRILQVTLFGTLQSNLSSLDFSVLLPDVMNRGRSGCAVDPIDGQLHERHEDVSGSVAATILPNDIARQYRYRLIGRHPSCKTNAGMCSASSEGTRPRKAFAML